ncbi:MAG: magnesium transporter [Bdellovibrionales bacterium]|nr:magnesium transporter [Bdellovibrionales bacterium]
MKLNPSTTSIVKRLLSGRNSRPLRSILNKLEPMDLASLLGQLNVRERRLLLEALLTIDKAAQTLWEVPDSQLPVFMKALSDQKLTELFISANDEHVAYFLSAMPEPEQERFLAELGSEKSSKVKQLLSYPEDSAGRLMESDIFTVLTDYTAKEGLEALRKAAQEQSIYYIYCVDKEQRLEGVLALRDLATAPQDTKLKDLIKKDVITVHPEASTEEAARIVAHYDFIAIPVVNKDKTLLGVITVDDVVDIIQEQATANIYAQVGLQEDDRVYSENFFKIKNRIPWMVLNLFLAAVASSVVSLFEGTMSELIILASLKNIVSGMGGNTAIQSLTVVTRGIATGDFSFITKAKTILKETLVGSSIGLVMGVLAGVLTYVWKGNLMVSIIICISMIINSLVASSMGAIVPIALDKLKKDPAAGSGVIVTTFMDIFSFFTFLGIASLGLKFIAH